MNSWQVSKVNHHNRTHSITLNFFSAAIWDSCIHVFSPLMRNNYNPPFCFHVDRKLSSQGKRQIVNVVCPSAGFVTFFFSSSAIGGISHIHLILSRQTYDDRFTPVKR